MPITFSVTCDSDEQLAKFLERFQLNQELLSPAVSEKPRATAKATASAGRPKKTTPKVKVSAPQKAPIKKVTKAAKAIATTKTAKTTKPVKAAKTAKTVKLTKPVKATSASKKSTKAVTSVGRKPGKLTPIIHEAIFEISKKGNPFRSREVINLVMKKAPQLNESSVITGVSKLLSESNLDREQIKDAVGRPYKLYKPRKTSA